MLKARDEAFGSFVSRTREDDLVLFISDHGFQSVTRTIHMVHLLKKLGFLEFSGQRHRGRRWRSTSAVSATSSRSGLDPDRVEDGPHLGHVLAGRVRRPVRLNHQAGALDVEDPEVLGVSGL